MSTTFWRYTRYTVQRRMRTPIGARLGRSEYLSPNIAGGLPGGDMGNVGWDRRSVGRDMIGVAWIVAIWLLMPTWCIAAAGTPLGVYAINEESLAQMQKRHPA